MITTALMTLDDLDDLRPFIAHDGVEAIVRQRLQARGLHLTARQDGKILACGGLLQAWDGVADVWVYFPPAPARERCRVYRVIRRELPHLMRLLGLWRAECVVRTDWPEAMRLVGHLGFAYEGTKTRYGPDGKDYHTYALLRRDKEAQP